MNAVSNRSIESLEPDVLPSIAMLEQPLNESLQQLNPRSFGKRLRIIIEAGLVTDQTNEAIDQTNERVDQTNERVEVRLTPIKVTIRRV